jgi:hypothetical protein
MLDRVDVLEPKARPELIRWLHGRAIAGKINSAILCATLKERPKGLPPTIQPVWLEEGEVVEVEQPAQAA